MSTLTDYRNKYLQHLELRLRPTTPKHLDEALEKGRKNGWLAKDLAITINAQHYYDDSVTYWLQSKNHLEKLVEQIPPAIAENRYQPFEYGPKPEKLPIEVIHERIELLKLCLNGMYETEVEAELAMQQLIASQK
jgi:hypothetical protein